MSASFIRRSVCQGIQAHTVQCCRTLSHLAQSISGCCIQEWTAGVLASIPEGSPASPEPLVDYLTPLLEAVKQPSMGSLVEFELGSALFSLEMRLEVLKEPGWQPPPNLCHAQACEPALPPSEACEPALAPRPHLTSTILPVKSHIQVHVLVGIIPAFATSSEDFHIVQHSLNSAC